MANSYLQRTPSGAGNRKTFTWSGWVKRSSVGSSGYLFTAKQDANNRFDFGWYTSGILFNSFLAILTFCDNLPDFQVYLISIINHSPLIRSSRYVFGISVL